MTHAHMTDEARRLILLKLDEFNDYLGMIEKNGWLDAEENASSVIYHLTTVLQHEIERMEIR